MICSGKFCVLVLILTDASWVQQLDKQASHHRTPSSAWPWGQELTFCTKYMKTGLFFKFSSAHLHLKTMASAGSDPFARASLLKDPLCFTLHRTSRLILTPLP